MVPDLDKRNSLTVSHGGFPFNLQVDLAHLLATRDQELRALTAEVTMFIEVLLSCYASLRNYNLHEYHLYLVVWDAMIYYCHKPDCHLM